MKHLHLLGLLTLLVVSAVGLQAQTSDLNETGNDTEAPALQNLETFMDATIETQMTALDIPAVSLAVVKDGRVLMAKGYGVSDQASGAPVTSETMFRPGSISKLFTWTAVMQMVEQGKLDLSTDVNTYLTDFQIPDTFEEPITLTHILTHTAGFEDGFLGYLFVKDPASVPPLSEALEKYMPRRINPPGAYSSYSNYATALAGLIVETVTGTPFNDYVEQNIFNPLGMTRSTFKEPLPANIAPFMAGGYQREAGVFAEQDFEIIANVGPAGALSSSASDMARFMMAYLNGGTLDGVSILSPATTEQTLSQLYTPDPRIAGMAHGFYENTVNGHRLVGHGGDTMLFHSNLMLNLQENLGIYVSYIGAQGGKARGELIQTFYDHYYPAPLEALSPPDDFGERAARYAGSYSFWRHNQSTIEKIVKLAGGIQVQPTADNTLVVSGFGETRQFVEIGENLFRQVDGKRVLAFRENESGAIQDMHIDGIVFMSASRTPTAENMLFGKLLPALAFILFATVWSGWAYRRKDYKAMQGGERTAILLSLAMTGTSFIFVLAFGAILASYGNDLVYAIPTSLKLSLLLPDLASILALGVAWQAAQAWRHRYWRTGRRIHYSLVALAGVYMLWFYYYWNILGVQFAG